MLKYLSIENIAVIESTQIDFSGGFNALTGETGAGKSIIIDSINAVLGERTSKDLIRKGSDKASVNALFSNLSKESLTALEENGYAPDEDGNLLICRTFSSSGGIVKINGKPATAGILRLVAKHLVNIHGQHDSQALLNPENHCYYIDRIAENEQEKENYYSEFKKLNNIRKQLSETEISEDEKARKIDTLEFQIKELEEAKITVGERQKLKEQLELAENLQKTVNGINNAYLLLSGEDESDGAITKINNAVRCVSAINAEEIKALSETLNRLSAELETASDELFCYLKSFEDGAFDKEKISDRLDLLNRLIRKYGGSEQACLDFLENAKKELKTINLSSEREEVLAKQLDESTERLITLADKLTKTREKASLKFANDVSQVIKYLDMPNAVFSVSIEKGRYTKSGCDNIEFIVKTNVGEDFKPLCKIASGGELSRIMLGIKSVLAEKDDVDTLIFDEIDAGISGFAAGKVGKQLCVVADSRQVICVTHLAQIASCADNHLKIEKQVKNDRTFTDVKVLEGDDRIAEIARIMSGTEITENLFNSAKELLDRRNQNGNL